MTETSWQGCWYWKGYTRLKACTFDSKQDQLVPQTGRMHDVGRQRHQEQDREADLEQITRLCPTHIDRPAQEMSSGVSIWTPHVDPWPTLQLPHALSIDKRNKMPTTIPCSESLYVYRPVET